MCSGDLLLGFSSGSSRSPRHSRRKGEPQQSFPHFFFFMFIHSFIFMLMYATLPQSLPLMSSGELNSNHILCSPCFSQGDSGLQGDKGEKVCAFERRNELALAHSLTVSCVFLCVCE